MIFHNNSKSQANLWMILIGRPGKCAANLRKQKLRKCVKQLWWENEVVIGELPKLCVKIRPDS